MLRSVFVLCITLLFVYSCRKDSLPETVEKYDVILVIGQSNTHFGDGIDPVLDTPSDEVLQLGRYDGNDHAVIPAVEPMDHHTRKIGRIGFALTFARLYASIYLQQDRKVLIIPAGHSGSGFNNHKWSKGDVLYEDAVERTLFTLKNFPGSRLVAVLWHQGENDVQNLSYQVLLDQFITDLRTDLDAPRVPFILGGMVPYWVDLKPERIATQEIIRDTPLRVENTGYADPSLPTVIAHDTVDNSVAAIHFTAQGLREMGWRYFKEYMELK